MVMFLKATKNQNKHNCSLCNFTCSISLVNPHVFFPKSGDSPPVTKETPYGLGSQRHGKGRENEIRASVVTHIR